MLSTGNIGQLLLSAGMAGLPWSLLLDFRHFQSNSDILQSILWISSGLKDENSLSWEAITKNVQYSNLQLIQFWLVESCLIKKEKFNF